MSPARRLRRAFIHVSFVISLLAFFLVGGSILLDQWIAGQASARFILGTAILTAGACVGLFAVTAAIGLAASMLLRDDALGDKRDPEARLPRATSALRGNAPPHGAAHESAQPLSLM
jgi:hypothetical protein